MIGITAYLGGEDYNRQILLKEKWHKLKEVYDYETVEGKKDAILYSYFDDYPIISYDINDSIVVIEGAIFNMSNEEIEDKVKKIVNALEPEALISGFVSEADGDFLVLIYHKEKRRLIIFNDELGAIPFHTYHDSHSFIVSRSQTFIAANIKQCSLSSEHLSEFLCFDYNMFDRTIFSNISHSLAAQCVIAEFNYENQINVKSFTTVDNSFALNDKYKTRKESLDELKDSFLQGTNCRINYARDNGYIIVNSMSGGFDSRTILAAIDKTAGEYINLTYQYTQDESVVARQCLKAIDSRSTFIKQSFNNNPDLYDSEIVLKTDGKVNVFTTSICFNDLYYSIKNSLKDKKVAFFGGFGGEFIRHPLFDTIWNRGNIGQSCVPSLQSISLLCNVEYVKVKKLISDSFSADSSREEFCKEYYDEYYRRYVRNAGEDRDRMFYFSVQPLMTKSFIKRIRTRFPLKWAGYIYHRRFLSTIDKRLVDVPIFGSKINIRSFLSLYWADLKHKSSIIALLKTIYKRKQRSQNVIISIERIKEFESNMGIHIFNEKCLKDNYSSYSNSFQIKLLTILEYLSELNRLRKSNHQDSIEYN